MNYLSLFLTLIAFNLFAQKTDTFRIDSLPTDGVLLDKGWKWQANDNPDFAKLDFDDSAWESIDILELMTKNSKILKAQLSWFRTNLVVDSSLINKPLMIDFYLMGAAEIYLNGELIHKIGIVSKDPQEEKLYLTNPNLPLSIVFSKTHNVIAVRYSFTQSKLYLGSNSNTFDFTITKPEGVSEKKINIQLFRSFKHSTLFGFFLILSLLHFSFYLYFSSEKVNLLIGFTMFIRACYFLNKEVELHITSVNTYFLNEFLDKTLFTLYYFLLILTVHRYLKKPLNALFWLIAGTMFLGFYLQIYQVQNATVLAGCILMGYYVYITFVEIRQGNKKGKLLYYSGILGLIGFIFIFLSRFVLGKQYQFFSFINSNGVLDELGLLIVYLSIPIAFALTLSRDFALTSRHLEKELEENKKLAEEKQQILADQNETLEKQVKERTAQLVSSQAQLIQSEKMASLGELTAGIAHEIQNPLNFVNNFSEVSNELIAEVLEERKKEKGMKNWKKKF